MRMHEERKQRNIDPFEMQVFQEEQSASLREYLNQVQRDRDQAEVESLSKAPSNAYKGFSQ